MAVRCPDWLTALHVADIKADIDGILANTRLSTTITYNRYSAGSAPTVSMDTGVLTSPYTATNSVAAFVGAFTAREVANNPTLQVGDLRCLFRKASVSGALTQNDQVVWDSKRYAVVWIDRALHAVDLVHVGLRLAGGSGG